MEEKKIEKEGKEKKNDEEKGHGAEKWLGVMMFVAPVSWYDWPTCEALLPRLKCVRRQKLMKMKERKDSGSIKWGTLIVERKW